MIRHNLRYIILLHKIMHLAVLRIEIGGDTNVSADRQAGSLGRSYMG